MAEANGFVTTSPDTEWGGALDALTANIPYCQKFTVPGASGTVEISEIGLWASTGGSSESVVMGIFTDDAGNACPDALVTNAGTTAITVLYNGGASGKNAHTYGTKPVLNAGQAYWLAFLGEDEILQDRKTSGPGTKYLSGTVTYPTWPSAAEWHGVSAVADRDSSLYAVYSVVGGAAQTFSLLEYGIG